VWFAIFLWAGALLAEDASVDTPARKEWRGDALEIFLAGQLAGVSDVDACVRRVVAGVRMGKRGLPQEIISQLNGALVEVGKTKGRLQVVIEDEGDYTELPGFSSEDVEILKSGMAGAGAAIVDLQKSNWRLVDGAFAEDDKLSKSARVVRVVLSEFNSSDGTFLCVKPKSSGFAESGRLKASELSLSGVAYVWASASWIPDAEGNVSLPDGFRYERTLIIPTKFAFLALPNIKQLPRGICTAAASINILSYLDPTIKLDQEGLFSLFNNKRAGATIEQVIGGLKNVGFEVLPVSKSLSDKECLAKVQASLDSNHPVLCATRTHMLTIIGYNSDEKNVLVWDQRQRGPNLEDGRPKGSYTVSESSLSSKFSVILLVRKAYDKPSMAEEEALRPIIGSLDGIQKHTLVNSNSGSEADRRFAARAVPEQITALLNAGRSVLVHTGKGEAVRVDPPFAEPLVGYVFPEGVQKPVSFNALTRAVTIAEGVYFSLPAPTSVPH